MEYIQDPVAFKKFLYYDCHCVNAGQSLEERRLKYAVVRSLGESRSTANRLRDWRKSTIARRFSFPDWNSLINFVKE